MGEAGVSAGWYLDPVARHEYRYWDGTRWTGDVADQGRQTLDATPLADAMATPGAIPRAPAGPPPPAAARSPARKGRPATILFWVFGILLLIVGGVGFAAANNANNHDDKTYATQLTELHGHVTGSETKAADLRARTNAVAVAMAAYTGLFSELTSAHNAMVDGNNRAVAQFNANGSVAIAQNELPPLIDRYQKAVAAQEAKQVALFAAVAKLQEATR